MYRGACAFRVSPLAGAAGLPPAPSRIARRLSKPGRRQWCDRKNLDCTGVGRRLDALCRGALVRRGLYYFGYDKRPPYPLLGRIRDRASRFRNSCTASAGSRTEGRPADHRWAGRVPDASAGRTSRIERDRSSRKPFFERRTRSMMQAFGSPKTPRTVGCGRKPGNAYASLSRRFRLDKIVIHT